MLATTQTTLSTQSQQYFQYQPAQVIDIVLSDTHQLYENIGDYGKIVAKPIFSSQLQQIFIAKPININFSNYPILHQIVMIHQNITHKEDLYAGKDSIQSQWYYDNSMTINIFGNRNGNPMFKISQQVIDKFCNTEQSDIDFGDGIRYRSNTNIIKSDIGQTVIQNRFGTTIKMFQHQTYPKLAIFNSKIFDSQYQNRILQYDFNKFGGILITQSSEQNIRLDIPTSNNNTLKKNRYNTQYNGNQLLCSFDRIVLNVKQNQLLLSSNLYTAIASNQQIGIQSQDIHIYAENELNLNSNTLVNINGGIVNINGQNPAILGNQLYNILSQLITQIQQIQVSTAVGLSSPPMNLVKLESIKQRMEIFLSKTTFIG